MARSIVFAIIAVAAALTGLALYSIKRRSRAEERDRAPSDEDLYARGEESAHVNAPAVLAPLASALHRAGIDTAPIAWLSGIVAVSIVSAACAAVLFGAAAALVGAGAVAIGAAVRVRVLQARRRALFDRQLVRMLPQLSASVRSSLTLERAVRVAAAHVEDPLREELERVLGEVSYGTSLAAAFSRMAQRTGSPDAAALAAAMRVQQRFGGSLSSVLDLVADHANARMKTERELRTELAGTRLAKWFVAASMPCIFLIMFASNADFSRFYREEPLGWAVLGLAAVLEVVGLIACQRITAFDRDRA